VVSSTAGKLNSNLTQIIMEGRPITVYDEPDITRPSPEILKKQRLRRLPGREISISSSEEELSSEDEEVISAIAKTIVVVEDPVKKLPPPPRKSSLSQHNHPGDGVKNSKQPSFDSQRSLDSTAAVGLRSPTFRSPIRSTKLSLEVPGGETAAAVRLELGGGSRNGSAGDGLNVEDGLDGGDGVGGRNRKRSVSFHSLVIAEETAPVYEESEKVATTSKENMSAGATAKPSSSNTLTVQESEKARNRRKSIETLVRPPTPPKHFN